VVEVTEIEDRRATVVEATEIEDRRATEVGATKIEVRGTTEMEGSVAFVDTSELVVVEQ